MNPVTRSLFLTCTLLVPHTLLAGPSAYVYTPTVVQGEREIDFKMGSAKSNGESRESAASIGFGYGVNEFWFSELYLKYKQEEGTTFYDAVEWENKFQLTETGEYPVDLGFLLEIERPADHAEGWEVKWGPLFQSQFDQVVLNANLLIENLYRSEEASKAQLLYQWQAKYLWKRTFDFGVQGFGEVGEWDRWAARNERPAQAGPAIFGKYLLGGRKMIQYNAAWLIGASSAAPDNTLRLQVEYEF